MKRLFPLILPLLFSMSSANAVKVDLMGTKTSLELFNDITASCTVTIEGQNYKFQDFREFDAAGVHVLQLSTNADERLDGIYAVASFHFASYSRTEYSNIRRTSKLQGFSLRAENYRSWGNTTVEFNSIKSNDIVITALAKSTISLEAKAWRKEGAPAVVKLECNPSSWVKISNN